jgi:signal transduction histidine kinase
MVSTGLKKRFIWGVVAAITTLLLLQWWLAQQNNQAIEDNLQAWRQAERVKVNALDIIRTLHQLDIGLRGYALVPDSHLIAPFDSAHIRIKQVFLILEKELTAQQFAMAPFYRMRDSVNAYFTFADSMFMTLQQGKHEIFLRMLAQDRGYFTWLQYKEFSAIVNTFENNIIETANSNYRAALHRNYQMVILLLVLVVPTLVFTGWSTIRAYKTSEQLRQATEENNRILSSQNEYLEREVDARTEEIATQNEEIMANLEAISHRNAQLEEAKALIEEKNRIIESRNKSLGQEVTQQTENLRESNRELIKNIHQLEQFSYSLSHNLRSPVARLMGLVNVLPYTRSEQETQEVIERIKGSAYDLDQVLKDLSHTIEIRKELHQRTQDLKLLPLLNKVCQQFEQEIHQHGIVLQTNLKATLVNSIPAYIESILFNLISNAIKYRHHTRALQIMIATEYADEQFILRVRDNGLGIDLNKNKRDLFTFYKRFHFHVEGRGLGLYLVKSQVDLLGGTISVTSELDHGTEFTVIIKHNLENLVSQ